jgi:hypothetical protein
LNAQRDEMGKLKIKHLKALSHYLFYSVSEASNIGIELFRKKKNNKNWVK